VNPHQPSWLLFLVLSVIFRGVLPTTIGDITIENLCFALKKPAESFLGVECGDSPVIRFEVQS